MVNIKNKTLVLIDDLYYMYGLSGLEQNNILFKPLLSKSGSQLSKIYRGIRKCHLGSVLPFKEMWMSDWISQISEYDTIVIGETGNAYNVACYIKKQFPNKRVIIWYRNSVKDTIDPCEFDSRICEVWSFDENDCKKYNLKFNPQFSLKSPLYKEHEIEYDAFFVGKDKGRLDILKKVENDLKAKGLRTMFCIVGYNSSPLSYKEVLDFISKSKIIVDIQADWQTGITLRPMESIFYNRKLITNSPNIKSFDFYNQNNIFQLDSGDDFDAFYSADYETVSPEIVHKYSLEGWVQRFFEN